MRERKRVSGTERAKRREERLAARGPRAQRLLFQRLGDRGGGIFGAAQSIRQMREEMRGTSPNVGNLVHLEAPAKLLRYDRRYERKRAAAGAPEEGVGADVGYDGIVLGYANMIRAFDSDDEEVRAARYEPMVRTDAWLSSAQAKIYALGIGIQDELAPTPDAIDRRLFGLLQTLNDRAAIFGVRGDTTAGWLHTVGLTNARALGCPSMFIYPRNLMGIRAPSRDRPLRIATAGRIQRNNNDRRLPAVNRIAEAFEASYIFQTDFYAAFRAEDADLPIYNDATGEVLASKVHERGRSLGFDFAFKDYWLFRSTEKWRGFAVGKDAYFGDRFHGGVVFLQAGRPALIVQNDARVKELTAFYDIPTATSEELLANDPVEVFHERLNEATLRRMRETYARRYRVFYDALREGGLELFSDVTPDEVDRMA